MGMRKGQRYRTRVDLPVIAMTEWAAPYTGGYERTLKAGEEFTIANDAPGTATMVYADAADYKRLHKEFIPLGDRLRFWSYRGWYLCLNIKDVQGKCELLYEPPWRR